MEGNEVEAGASTPRLRPQTTRQRLYDLNVGVSISEANSLV